MLKWQEQVEEIIKESFPDDTSDLVKKATRVINIAHSIGPPPGDLGKVIAELMKQASKELPPLGASYTGFMLGVAWERANAG